MDYTEQIRRGMKFTCATLLCSLAGLSVAEEASILDNATLSTAGNVRAWTSPKAPLIDGTFNTLQYQDSVTLAGEAELSIILPKSETVLSAFVQNRYDSGK